MAGTNAHTYRIAHAAQTPRPSYIVQQQVSQQVVQIASQSTQSVQSTRSVQMAGAPQYNFPPPPPPPGPPPSNHPQQHPQYAYQPQQPQPQYQQAQRGGGGLRGGRGGHQSGPYNPQQPGLYNGPQGPPQQQQQGPPNGYPGPNNQQLQPYIGPQAPGPQGPPNYQGPPNGYPAPQPQWQNSQQQNQQHGPPQHRGPLQQQQRLPQPPMQQQPMQQPPMQQPPPLQVAPLSTNNYHPNYAPQIYQPQYGNQQSPQQQYPPQPPYGHSVPNQAPHGGPPPQWNGPPQPARPPFNNNRGRGGFQNSRGGHEAPLMGPPIRMGFDNDRGGHKAQAGNGFPPPYQTQTPPQFSQAQPYQAYPPPDYSGQRSSLDPNPYNSGPNRGRGGNVNNIRGNGRGNFQQSRGRDNRHHNNNQRAPSENFHKQPAGADVNGKKKKKRRTNTLGLTPNGADHEESDEEIDDVDEEARLVTLLGPDTPQLPTDLDAWLAERRSRFPTKARREAAAEELRQRRMQNRKNRNNQEPEIKKEEGETELEKQQRKAEKLRRELERTERKIQEEASGTSKRKRENGDEGDEERGQAGNDSDSSSGSESEDAPEVASTRHHVPMRVHQPPKAQLQRHCKYFSTGGTCGKKGKCRFVHDQEVRNQALREKEANGGKMTLAQRLILNDTAKDDLTILKSIKYLKEKGLMPDQLTASVGSERFKSEENGYAENLNYGDN